MCIVNDVMRKHEEYARGWVRLHPNETEAQEMAQYAIDQLKLRHSHEDRCSVCRQAEIVR